MTGSVRTYDVGMPFTAAHPAAVLAVAPLIRWGLPVPALVIGSIVPDLFMMLPVAVLVHFAHVPLGLVTVDVAVGVAAFVAWQRFYGPAVMALIAKAWRPSLHRPWWTVGLAVLLGAATHLAWDSFTHDWMWGTQHIAWLAERHGPLRGFEWVRHVSEVVGMAVVAAWAARWWRRAVAQPDLPPGRRALGRLVVLGPAAVAFGLLLVRDSFFTAVTTAAGLALIGLTLVALRLKPR